MPSRRSLLGAVALVLVAGVLVSPALAHVPAFGGDNDSPANATAVPNPTKSWAYYDHVPADGAAYYRAYLLAGEELSLSAFTPVRSLRPSLVIMSPAIDSTAGVPPWVIVPEGYGARVIEGAQPAAAAFEPFTPGAYYYSAASEFAVQSDATYLVAVYDPGRRAGPAGLAIGSSEQFTPLEYLTVPVDVLRVHDWEGDTPLVVFGPPLVVGVAGLAVLRRRVQDRRAHRVTRWGLGVAVVAVVATSATLSIQLGLALAMTGPTLAALVPLALLVVPLAIARWLAGLVTAEPLSLPPRRRVGLALAGVGLAVTWAGLLVAPAITVLLAVVPAAWEP